MKKYRRFLTFLILLLLFTRIGLFGNALVTAVITVDSVSCFNARDGKVYAQVINGTEPYSFYLIKDDVLSPPIDSIKNTTDENVTFSGLDVGRYWVLVVDDDGDADFSNSERIYQPGALTVSAISVYKGLSCYNSCDGALKVSVSGGNKPYTFVWTRLNPLPVTVMADTDSVLNNICQGTYQVLVNDSKNCGGAGISKSFPFVRANPLARDSIPALLAGGTVGTSQSICYNADVPAFTSSAPASGGSGSYLSLIHI